MLTTRTTLAGLKDLPTAQLSDLIAPRDYTKLNKDECELRLWLPEPARRSLDEICEIHDVSMTVYLTEYFATYLFGHHEMLRMRSEKIGLYEPKPETRYSMETTREPPEPNLGKNIYALKIWVPEKIKSGLQIFADRANVKLGEFSRALICAHLFGRDYGPKKLMTNSTLNESIAKAWENDSQHI